MAAATFSHIVADFVGVPAAQLMDASLISGLLVAAAGAAGLPVIGAPIVRPRHGGGVAAILLLDGCHVAVHTFPERELMLLDVLAGEDHHGERALEVFKRRVTAREIRRDVRTRG
ncbi:MAG TPA: S-adenosylmethionine decarboxylase [Gemmatimonadaceae bacterium]|nr:S-adenosylmethionine decarboxylase [Gemmatimonadaceae bacterium]